MRGVKCQSGTSVLLNCQVFASGPMPVFLYEGGGTSVKSENIITAVNTVLRSIA